MNSIQIVRTKESKTILPNINAQEINGTLYFTVDRGNQFKESWKTDGTPDGTIFISKI